ncbi:MAG: lysine transporter LysE [Desulfuromonas sp.]|nr:MAG: lysine transporter LysE [Desulfuromonas sp.]
MPSGEFLLTSLIVVLIPGTGVIYTVSNGLVLGRRASVAAACGCTLGILPHLAACVLGLSALLHMSALAFQCVRYLGAAYLLYLAWQMWRETGGLCFDAPDQQSSLRRIAVRGFLINILNPKLSIFFLAFIPLFVTPGSATPILEMIVLSAIFMAMTLVIFILYGLSANAVRSRVAGAPKVITRLQRTFAAIFAALGLKLALSES